MGRGGFSTHGPVGFRGGSSFGSASHLGSAPRFGTAFGTGSRQPAFRTRGSFGGFHQPVSGSRHFHHRVFFGSVFPGYYGHYGYPAYYGGSFYSTSDYYPGYDYSAPPDSAQNDIAQQQDIDRLEDEVARCGSNAIPVAGSRAPGRKPKAHLNPLCWSSATSTQEVQNCAVVGGTLWIFRQRAESFHSRLDIEATTKANDDRGLNFQVPVPR